MFIQRVRGVVLLAYNTLNAEIWSRLYFYRIQIKRSPILLNAVEWARKMQMLGILCETSFLDLRVAGSTLASNITIETCYIKLNILAHFNNILEKKIATFVDFLQYLSIRNLN